MAQPPDPQILASILHGYGQGWTRFNTALEQVPAIVPKLNEMGLRCRKIAEWTDEHPTQLGKNQTVVTLELYQK